MKLNLSVFRFSQNVNGGLQQCGRDSVVPREPGADVKIAPMVMVLSSMRAHK